MHMHGSPRFGGETYYRYNSWEQRHKMQSITQGSAFRFENPDTTSVTWFPNPQEGVAKVDVVELRGPLDDCEQLKNTEATRKAETWVKNKFAEAGIQQVPKPEGWHF